MIDSFIKEGSGEIIVFVHGALADKTMWLPHINLLKSNFQAIAITQRHFGGASVGNFGMDTHADDLANFLKQFNNVEKIHLVGWSYGSDVILNMLTKNSIIISSAFLFEPGYPGCLSDESFRDWQADANVAFGPVFQFVSEGKFDSAVEALIDSSGNREGYFKSQPKQLQQQLLDKAETLKLQLNQQERPELNSTALSKIDIPITIAYGSKTRLMFSLVSTSVQRSLPSSKLIVVQDETHMLPMERPHKFVDLIRQHIEQN